MDTLGKMIGKVVDNFSITNHNGNSTQLRIVWDFTTSSDDEIKSWLCGNRRIVFQRPSRSLSVDELNKLDGTTLLASSAGHKIKSRQERIDALIATGLPEKLAIFAVEQPSKFKEVVGDLDVE